MSAEWLSNSSGVAVRVSSGLQTVLREMALPARARGLRQGLLLLFAIWAVFALSRLIWAFLPASGQAIPPDVTIINPVSSQNSGAESASVNIQRMMNWHLFGKAGAPPSTEAPVVALEVQSSSALDGIEKGARETRLELVLRGIVASSEEGLGHAIIEHRKRQDVYAVQDKLPVGSKVVLAKVMPQQVVLDNNGKYELLTLFDETQLSAQAVAAPVTRSPARSAPPVSARMVDKSGDSGATSLALSYRQRLYQNPQSLAEVVSVAAVREDGQLRGYRITPGKDKAQFAQLGFKKGDLVTGVNGIALDDPANTMKLYQAMRSANEAVFDLERDNQQVTINVSLDDTAQR